MGRHLFLGTVTILFSLSTAWAEYGGTTAQYLQVKETTVETSFDARMGVGLLDTPGLTGGRGTPITNFFGVNYAVTSDFEMMVGVPLAGTLSSGDDNYGLGNIVLGGKYIVPLDRLAVGIGMDMDLPTAQAGAAVGLSTRPYARFLQDTFTFSPFLVVSYVFDRLTLTADLGTNIQIATNAPAGRDRIENAVFYDGGVALSVYENFWGTVELLGYTTTSIAAKTTALFAGPGFRYQDRELSVGFHLMAPFRKPARDVIDFLGVFDVRVLF